MTVVLHPEAVQEFRDAALYYATCQPGLEKRFVAAIETALGQVGTAPLRWRAFEGEIRRYLVRVFPYAVLYAVEDDRIFVVAITHCLREPGYWKRRVKK